LRFDQPGRVMIAWVWVTSATRLPASSRRSVCTTIVVLPTRSGVAIPWTAPTMTGRKKLGFGCP
jgi:hypothetical protein